MKKVLILGVAAVQMDAIAQLNRMGCETWAAAMAMDGPGARIARHFDQINILDEPKLQAHILRHQIDAVYSTGSDLAMPVACRLSEKLGLPHFVSSETADICNHKDRMRERLTRECSGNIPYQVMDSVQQATVGFPSILKPSDSQGQRGIYLVGSQQQLESRFASARQFSRDGRVIVERYIDGPEISVNGYLVDGRLRFLAASDRVTWPEYTGLIHRHVVPARAVGMMEDSRLRDTVLDACRRVGIQNGPVYFQIKLEKGHPYIIEMTPRLDGCHMWNVLQKAAGVNLMKLVFEHLLFGRVDELQKLRAVRPMELVFWCQKPGSQMERGVFKLPRDAVEHFYYYQNGEYVRPVNGKFDKVGYYIRKL